MLQGIEIPGREREGEREAKERERAQETTGKLRKLLLRVKINKIVLSRRRRKPIPSGVFRVVVMSSTTLGSEVIA